MVTLSNPAPKGWRGRGWIPGVHRGIDYGWLTANPEGSKDIVASVAGTVVSVAGGGGWNGGWGNLVIIHHGGGTHTAYAHLRTGSIAVKVGQAVKAGQFLGKMGSTGDADGDHLHFELRLGGAGGDHRVDPAPYFARDLPGITAAPAPSGRSRTVRQIGKLNGRRGASTTTEAVQTLSGGDVGDFDGYVRGQRVSIDGVTSDIWYRGAYRGNFFSAAGFTSQSTAGLADLGTWAAPAPAKRKYVRLGEPWYYYHDLNNALKGDYATSQRLAAGDYELVRIHGANGPRLVESPYGRVWVGSRTVPPVIEK